jgi:hypothetical protein
MEQLHKYNLGVKPIQARASKKIPKGKLTNNSAIKRHSMYRLTWKLIKPKMSAYYGEGTITVSAESGEQAREEFLVSHNCFGRKYTIIKTTKLKPKHDSSTIL